MKKSILFICLVMSMFICGCTKKGSEVPKTEYDDKAVVKIVTSCGEGMPMIPCSYVRTFDFEKGQIIDVREAYLENLEDQLTEEEKNRYNNPSVIATIQYEQVTEFLNDVKTLGIYIWEKEYITTDVICDGSSKDISIYFSDGTIKKTDIYFLTPPNYDKISDAFETHFGVKMYFSN